MKGICFIEPLFYKIVDGSKTQTRRIISEKLGTYCSKCHKNYLVCECYFENDNHANKCTKTITIENVKPRYKVGEVVYLKEPYYGINKVFWYKYDKDRETAIANYLWKNKLFMPEMAARHFIKITEVRAERLQDISEVDCLKEGIWEANNIGLDGISYWYPSCVNSQYKTPQDAYAALIDRINGKGTWESNPFVWVYDFELIKN